MGMGIIDEARAWISNTLGQYLKTKTSLIDSDNNDLNTTGGSLDVNLTTSEIFVHVNNSILDVDARIINIPDVNVINSSINTNATIQNQVNVNVVNAILPVEDFNQYFDRNYFCEFKSTGFPTFGTGYQLIYQRDQKFDIESITLAGSVGNIYYRIIVDGFIIFDGFAPDHSSFYVANTIMNLNFNWVYHAVTQTLFFQPKLHLRCNSQLKIEAKTASGLGTISLFRISGNGR